ncbi:hypothetical protein F66182_12381, partial [Fusarium sp. NRRL 66182]
MVSSTIVIFAERFYARTLE